MNQLEMHNIKKCPLCDFQAKRQHLNHPGYQEPHQFDIYHCHQCEAAFCDPLEIDKDVYDHIYRQISDMPGYSRYYRYSQQVLEVDDPLKYLSQAEDVYWSIKTTLEQRHSKQIEILEVGCGFGYLTYALSQNGYPAKGIDISQVAIDHATKAYGNLYQCIDLNTLAREASPHQYDIIIATEVIEHIKDVKGFLASAAKLLKTNGQLILTTPNRSVYSSHVLWETECPPVHLFWLSEKTMVTLAEQLGMKIHFVDMTEFSLHEIERWNSYSIPVSVKELLPSRKPTLDAAGNIIRYEADHVQHLASIPAESTWRRSIKKALDNVGLLQPLAAQKSKILKTFNRFKSALYHMQLRYFVKITRPKRTPLCAVMIKID
jgi:2-polyprenyl-3-methyl-5-hydroxy-6-metoxy-1,4-benzoquinol methylase